MALDDFSNIVVSTGGAALSQVGFGTLLIAAWHNKFADEIREYLSADEAVADGFETDDPVYQMLQAGFAQRPKPRKIKLGKLTSRPAQTIVITPIATNSVAYAIQLGENDLALESISYTSDGSATVAEICTGLRAAIIANANLSHVVATDNTTNLTLTITGGNVLKFAGWDTARLTLVDNTPGQTLRLTPLALNQVEYAFTGYTKGKTAAVTYTSDATATVNEICDGLQAAIHAAGFPGVTVVPDNATATYIDIKSTSGRLFFVKNWRRDRIKFEDVTADPGIAADLAGLRVLDDDWYGLAIWHNAALITEEAADWAETQLLIFGYNTSSWRDCVAGQTTNIGQILKGKGYARSIGIFNGNDTGAYGGVRMCAERFPHDPGSRGYGGTWHAKQLRGQIADVLTSSEKTAIQGYNLQPYITTSKTRSHTLGGKTASGEYADVIRFLDWFRVRLQERLATVQLDNEIVPFDETGLALYEAACRAQLKAGRKTGGIAATDADGNEPSVQVPTLADTDEIDRKARVLRDITISFRLAGAIHMVDPVNVTATV